MNGSRWPGAFDAIGTAVQIDSDLARILRIEAPGVIRNRRVSSRGGDGRSIRSRVDHHPVVLIREVHVHALGQIAIEAVDVRREGGATSLERLGQCAVVERAPWLRQIRRYAIDDFVAPGRLKLLRQLVVHAPVHIGEQPAIDFRGVAGRAFQVAAVFIGELEQARLTRSHRGNDQPVVAHERHVRILRQRLPSGLTGDPHPAPLAAAAIVVLDEQVEDAGAQECPAVNPIGRPRQPARPEIGGRDDFGRPGEAGPSTGACCRILLERADLIGKRLAKRAQRRVVGHDHEARGRVRDPGGLGQDRAASRRRPGGLRMSHHAAASPASCRAIPRAAAVPVPCGATGTCTTSRPRRASPGPRSGGRQPVAPARARRLRLVKLRTGTSTGVVHTSRYPSPNQRRSVGVALYSGPAVTDFFS